MNGDAYNHYHYAKRKDLDAGWGGRNLWPQQFMTQWPHTPDNSFAGFVVDKPDIEALKLADRDPKKALLYGKRANVLNKLPTLFLNKLKERFNIHATIFDKKLSDGNSHENLPEYVTNHGNQKQTDFLHMLRTSHIYVGLGWPVEGPAALEAIASGTIFLQPRYDNPWRARKNAPSDRRYTSQNPYVEKFIGQPHVWTFSYKDEQEIEDVLDKISDLTIQPKVPYEFTHEGMLIRISTYIEKQNFCWLSEVYAPKIGPNGPSTFHSPNIDLSYFKLNTSIPNEWPPRRSLNIKLGNPTESCATVCERHNLRCEPSFFPIINATAENQFQNLASLTCRETYVTDEIFAPSYESNRRICHVQKDPLLFSCAGDNRLQRRLCPCRDYMPEQVALCQECLS